TLAPEKWLAEAATLLAENGEAFVLLAKEEAPNRQDLRQIESISYTWPGSGHARMLVRYAKK
ncbi:MAG: hypothetical protein ACREJX_08045, partial [Polyangiaceae bacterium]